MNRIFEYEGKNIAEMADKELLTAIHKNEDSRNYPDSATIILASEGIKRILTSNAELAEKQAAAREKIIQEMTAQTDVEKDGGD